MFSSMSVRYFGGYILKLNIYLLSLLQICGRLVIGHLFDQLLNKRARLDIDEVQGFGQFTAQGRFATARLPYQEDGQRLFVTGLDRVLRYLFLGKIDDGMFRSVRVLSDILERFELV